MRYKIGDRVMVRKDLVVNVSYPYEIVNEKLFFNANMEKYRGKFGTIIERTDLYADEYFISVEGKKVEWYFNNAMLMPVGNLNLLISKRKENKNYVHSYKNR